VTLCPAGSTQPVAASGVFAFGAAATQMVCDIWLTNVTRRWSPAGWPAAPEGGGSEAAGAVGEGRPSAADPVDAGITGDAGDRVAVVLRECGDGRSVAVCVTAAAGLDDPFPAVAVPGAVTGACPPVALVPRAAQPAVKVIAVSAAAVKNARAHQARRLAFPRLPRPACPPILTRALPVRVRFCAGRRAAVVADNRFL
jgi:hypothetical protein